jgi:hypothetical protein
MALHIPVQDAASLRGKRSFHLAVKVAIWLVALL